MSTSSSAGAEQGADASSRTPRVQPNAAPQITSAERLDRSRWSQRWALTLKAALVTASLAAAVAPLDQLDGKGMAWRLPIVAAAAAVVPLAWRRRFTHYPATADLLLMSPFALDLVGNLAGWYDSFSRFDDVFHLVNWVLLVAAYLAWRFRRTSSLADAVMLGTGFGAIAIVAWEIAEWAAGELGAGEALGLTYADTISDLALSTLGGLVGALIAVRLLGPAAARHQPDTNRTRRASVAPTHEEAP